MGKKLKRTFWIVLLCVIVVVCFLFCLSACDEHTPIKAFIDDEEVSFNNVQEMFDFTPEKNGYRFTGWIYYVNGEPTPATADLLSQNNVYCPFYATWEIVDYTVVFVVDGVDYVTDTYTIEKKPTIPEVPHKEYYTGAWDKTEFTTGDVTINAVYTPIKYDIVYKDIYDSVNDNILTYTVESEYTFARPERPGYSFNGWYDKAGNKVEKIEKGTHGNLILSAEWTTKLYNITYTNTRGQSIGNVPSIYSIESATISLPELSSYGYTFNGWYNGDTKVSEIKSGTLGNLTLEARWTPIKYTVTYNNLQGSENTNPTEYTIESSRIVLNDVSTKGYNFDGWYIGGTKVESIGGGTAGDKTLEAHWTPAIYTVVYNNTKGATNNNPTQYTIESAELYLENIWSAGYNFDGWYNGNTKVESIAAKSTGNIVLEARWTPITYTITYQRVENSINNNPTTYTADNGPIILSAPEKAGYMFNGWYSDPSLTQRVNEIDVSSPRNIVLYADWSLAQYNAYYYDGTTLVYTHPFNMGSTVWIDPDVPEKNGYKGTWSDYTVVAEDIYIFAEYTALEYTISYLNLKDAENENITTYTADDPTTELKPLSANGYTFLGWYDGENPVKEIKRGSLGNKVLTAHWETTVYTITYENLKNTSSSELVYRYTIESETISLPNNLSVNGYIFGGWLNENGEPVNYIERGSFGNRVITAKLTPIVYNIVYENVGNAQNPNASTYTAESGIVLKPLSRKGYGFLGWYNGDEAVNEICVGEYGNKTLSAKWAVTTYRISYNNTKGVDTSDFVFEYTIESETIVLPSSLSVVGYSFNGWRDAEGKRTERINQGSFGNVELTADFLPVAYNINYKNINSAINPNPLNYNIEDYIELKALQRNGYTFLGWYQGGNRISTIEVGTFGDLELTAKWELAVYTITYNGTFGADISSFVSSYTIESDTIKLPMDVKVSGYTFNGWKNEDGSNITEIRKGSYGDFILTADLTPTKYVVSLEAMDGSVNKSSVTVLYGQDYKLPVPSFENGSFVGWYNNTGDDATRMTDENGNSISGYPYRLSRTFYAHYIINKYTVTFDSDGGTSVPAQVYSSGSRFVESSALTERGDDLFEGWFTADGTRFTDGMPITATVALKAHWAESIGISDMDGLIAIAENPTANYHLNNDINMKGNVWKPIENFSGVLDGKGYVVKNFILNCTSSVSSFAFININNGTIKNLVFEDFTYNVSVSGRINISLAIMIAENNGDIENCVVNSGYVNVYIEGNDWDNGYDHNSKFGSIVGDNKQNAIIKNCSSKVDVVITSNMVNSFHNDWGGSDIQQSLFLGGIVGNNSSLVESCHFDAKFSITAYANGDGYYGKNKIYFGGIIGYNGSVCQKNYIDAELILKTSTGWRGENNTDMGGIVGKNENGIIDSCYSMGTIKGESEQGADVAGIVGVNASSGKIENCYSAANVSSDREGDIGGFVGYNLGIIQNSYAKGSVASTAGGNTAGFVAENTSSGTVTKCYASGNVDAKSGSAGYFVASSSGTLFKCFYLSTSTLVLNGVPYEYITELETVNGILNQILWSKEFLAGELYWDEEGWIILTNEAPVLDWEIDYDDYDETIFEPDCENIGYSVFVEKKGIRFFIRNFVEAWGHSYDEENAVVFEPTCITQGYTEYTCMICEHIERMDYTDATGHIKGEEKEHKAPTCDEIGYTIHFCKVCKEELRTEIPALGHTPIVMVERTNPVCGKNENGDFFETSGLTERIGCSVCKTVLQEQSVIEPHDFVIAATTAPTCTVNGYGTYTCRYENCGFKVEKEIPSTGHSDVNGDHRCDVCKELLGIYEGETVIEIKTPADLLKISSNMNGVYKLMNDIDMNNTVWTPIGTADQPFTGYFEGNGKAIKNLVGENKTFVSMFGYVRGIVHGLTLNYANGVTVNVANDGKIGMLAETNDGSIISCNIVGTINVNFSYVTSSGAFADTDQVATGVFGGIVHTNGSIGVISDCSVSATFKVTYTHKFTLTTEWSMGVLFQRSYRYSHTSDFNVYFGAIAGINSGLIKTCTFSGKVEHGGDTTAKVNHANGHVYVTTNVYFESFAAINHMTIDSCESLLNFQGSQSSTSWRYFGGFWTEKENFNLTIEGKKYVKEQ